MAFKGAWNSSAAYATGDAVSENGSSYIALKANAVIDPAIDVAGAGGNWALLALRGTNGANGANGTNGTNGAAETVSVGTVATGAPGTPASVTNSGIGSAAVLNFTIPQGATGATGPQGPLRHNPRAQVQRESRTRLAQ